MYVVAGFIVGFDTERNRIAGAMLECIEATNIPICMVGLLTALPKTQLTRRLEKEGRPEGFQRCRSMHRRSEFRHLAATARDTARLQGRAAKYLPAGRLFRAR